MEDLDETTVTEAVLEQMATTADPRLREIMEAAVRHLHAFPPGVHLAVGYAGRLAHGEHPP